MGRGVGWGGVEGIGEQAVMQYVGSDVRGYRIKRRTVTAAWVLRGRLQQAVTTREASYFHFTAAIGYRAAGSTAGATGNAAPHAADAGPIGDGHGAGALLPLQLCYCCY